MANENPSGSPKSVKEQLEESARGIWTTVMESKGGSPPGEMSINDEQEGKQMSLESVMRAVFGSCTSGNQGGDLSTAASAEILENTKNALDPNSPSSNRDRLYKKLFADSHLRAEEAVFHLRQQLEQRRAAQRGPPRTMKGKEVPGMFPASDPRTSSDPPEFIDPSTGNLDVSTLSFDDGISIVTQQTLEEMAQDMDLADFLRVHSDVTQDPIDFTGETWKDTSYSPSPGRRRPGGMSPFALSRIRSHGTTQTKRSFGAKSQATKSTMSSQSHEFESLLQKEEQKYWEEVVKEQDEVEEAETPANRNQRLLNERMRRPSDVTQGEKVRNLIT